MKMRWTLGIAALLMSSAVACSDARSNEGLVARVGDHELTVEDVAELMVNEERLPAQVTVVQQVADLWIQYTLLGAALSRDTTLSSIEFEPLVRQQLDQLMIFQLRDSVVQVVPSFRAELPPGGSTAITSAPRSASIWPQSRPRSFVRSSTR